MVKRTGRYRSLPLRILRLDSPFTAKLKARIAEALEYPERYTPEDRAQLAQWFRWYTSAVEHPSRKGKEEKFVTEFVSEIIKVQGFDVGRDRPFTYKAPRMMVIVNKHHDVTGNKTETIKRVAAELHVSTRTVSTLLDDFGIVLFNIKRPLRRKV